MPFWIQTPTHPCTSHPLHSLEHNIYFHHLPFSVIFYFMLSSEHGRVYANVGGVHISDPKCNITVGIMFWFAYFSVVFCIQQDLHKKEQTMVFEAHGMPFPCTELLLIQFKFICIALFTIQIVAKQLYRKLSFYNIFIYCRNLIYLTYVKIW